MKTLSQPGLTFQTHDPSPEVRITPQKSSLENNEVKIPINKISKFVIEKKSLNKDLKQNKQ